jgi:uncharacterized protein
MEFKDIVTDPARFRGLMGEPPPPCVAKTIAIADRHCRAFIARSPFVLIASANALGQMDISPKGDAPGFVRVLDDTTLAIPDRPGNRRADTFTNVLENPKIGLIFFVPGKSETLRFSGSARIVRDADLRESMSAHGKMPDFVLAVEIEEAFFHCSKCIVRSSLWKPAAWPSLDGLPSLAQTMVDAAKLPMPVEALEEIIKQDESERLY